MKKKMSSCRAMVVVHGDLSGDGTSLCESDLSGNKMLLRDGALSRNGMLLRNDKGAARIRLTRAALVDSPSLFNR